MVKKDKDDQLEYASLTEVLDERPSSEEARKSKRNQ